MIRLAWRQMRLPAISTAVLLAAVAAVLVLTQQSMSGYLHSSGLSSCLAGHGDCTELVNDFLTRYGVWRGLVYALGFAPVLVGLFWGAPLIAREAEQGTHRLAWSQSVSRRRWLAVRVGLYLLGAVAVGALLTWLLTWWYGPLARAEPTAYTGIQPQIFESRGLIPVATMLYAFAVGTAAGALIRRTVPAMAVAVAGYAAQRVFFLFERGHLLPPKTLSYPFGRYPGGVLDTAWTLNDQLIDGSGQRAAPLAIADACPVAAAPRHGGIQALAPCADAHGFRELVTYQPLSRFWPLQLTESAILLGVTVLLLGVATWWTLRRIS